MKFKLVESINEQKLIEDVEEELQLEQQLVNEIIDEIRGILIPKGFEESQKLNGVAFNYEYSDNDGLKVVAQVYLEQDEKTYSMYIQSTKEEIVSNFSAKGELDSAIESVNKLLSNLQLEE